MHLAKLHDVERALLAARADITKYTIWHKSHTARGLFDGTPISTESMWRTDVEALADYVERLLRMYWLANRRSELPAVLERLRSNIQSRAWHHKIIFFQCLNALGPEWNVERGLHEIAKLGPIDQVEDPELLAMYLDLYGDRISLAQRLPLIDHVIHQTEDASTRIHQGVVKTILLMTYNDSRGAAQSADDVIKYCEKLDDLDIFQRQKFGHALLLMSDIDKNSEMEGDDSNNYIRRAIEQFENVISDDQLSASGRADVFRDIADAYRANKNWKESLRYYDHAIEEEDRIVLHVFRAECLNRLGRYDEAHREMDAISIEKFDSDPEKADYVMRFASLAVEAGELDRLKRARCLLDIPLETQPMFYQQALRMKTMVFEAMEKGKSPSLTARAKAMLSTLSACLMLQPNFMGVGINLNKLIDDNTAVKRAGRADGGDGRRID